ncbi:hypothetical protein [Sphingobacterium sp. BIGb0165]|uniref:hypothetical protein n=1 Tax=Sphingobacterium sp. BIGb0165 TaxID=2940615 RepID=UPI002169F973|nr:hypothetical protein [Sphingobacterium sp. BIGb0165]MCS4225802.1 hypothetical protein [Sphingobacterium sp. BIGb0165]
MVISIVIILVAYVAIQTWSVINLSPSLLWNRAKYKKFAELQEKLQWDNFLMYRVTQRSNDGIRYFPERNFFLITGSPYFIKIDRGGNKVFELENSPKLKFLDAINCYVTTEDGIYDFSAESPRIEHFAEVLNKDTALSNKVWVEEFFGKFYNTADVVLFSYHTELVNREAVYFRQHGKWIKLYTPKSSSFIYAEGSKIECKINKEQILPKWQDEHFLKDVQNATYSNGLRYTDSYITPFNSDNVFFSDQKLEYIKKGKLKTLAFAKETYTTEGYLNPGIPNQFYGTAYYDLAIENTTLNFKTVANKASFRGEIETYLHVFELPAKYAAQSNVRFLTYDYSTNFHENKKQGVYIIKNIGN